jgi:hypothetical protein
MVKYLKILKNQFLHYKLKTKLNTILTNIYILSTLVETKPIDHIKVRNF